MNKRETMFFGFLFVVYAGGCGTSGPYSIRGYETGVTKESKVDDIMLKWEVGEKFRGWTQDFDAYRHKFLYRGIVDGSFQIDYEESHVTSDRNWPRSRSTQRLFYDLSKSKTIILQGFKIEIEGADRDKIRFKVIEAPAELAQPKGKRD
jgi:hypothetical protein